MGHQRAEGVDLRGAARPGRARPVPHQSRSAEAQGDHRAARPDALGGARRHRVPHRLRPHRRPGPQGDQAARGEGSAGRKTPQELEARLASLQNDVNSPFYDKNSPQHTAVRQEVEQIYKELYKDKE